MTVNTLTANVLCTVHNRALSEADKAAGELTAALSAFWETWLKRRTPGLTYTRKEFVVSGPLIQRWFIKTVLTNSVQLGMSIGSFTAEPGTPTDELVDIAYGRRDPSGHIGLCGAGVLSGALRVEDAFGIWLWDNFDTRNPQRSYVGGALCTYRGLAFVLNLDHRSPVPIKTFQDNPGWRDTRIVTPPGGVEVPEVALCLTFAWP